MVKYLMMVLMVCAAVLRSQSAGERETPAEKGTVDTIRTYRLPEIVVTASRMARPYDEIGRSVTVFRKQEIHSFVPLNVGEVLTRMPGSFVVGAGQNPGMIQSLFLRGAGNNQTAFFIDDVRLTDPSSVNGALDLSEISLAGTEQIEIVRGSHSTLYGSSAVGGVVNLITEQPRFTGLNLATGLSGGVFGSNTLALNQSLSLGYLDESGFYGSGEINNASFKGLDATLDTITNPVAFKNRDRDGFKKTDLFAKIGYNDRLFDLHLSARNARQKADIDDGAYRDDDNSRLTFDRTLFTYGFTYKPLDGLQVKYIGGRSLMNRDAVDDSSVVDWTGRTDGVFTENHWSGSTTTNEIQLLMGWNGVKGIVGVGEYREAMSSRAYFYWVSSFGVYESRSNLPVQKATTRSAFGHIELEGYLFHPSLSRAMLTTGLRFSQHSTFGTHWTFEMNPAYRVSDKGLLFGSVTTGFNAPSLYQLFTPESNYLSGVTRGNRLLRPERSFSWELGFRHEVFDGLRIAASAFQTTVHDAIEYVYLWDKNIGIDTLGNDWMRDDFRGDTYLNLGRQTTNGVEVSAIIGWQRLEVEGQVTILQGKIQYSPNHIRSEQTRGHHVQLFNNGDFLRVNSTSTELVRRPRTSATVRLTYRANERSDSHILIRYAASRPDVFYDSRRGPYGALGTRSVKPYTIVDFSQRMELMPSLSLFARVENVFNTAYQEILGFTTRGRGIYVSLRYTVSNLLTSVNQ
jgi:vitamin B12 transporter